MNPSDLIGTSAKFDYAGLMPSRGVVPFCAAIILQETIMSGSDTDLSAAFIAQQHKRLIALRQQLLGGEETTNADMQSDEEEHGEEAEEFEDAAQSMEQNEVNQALHDVNDRRIHDIERALEKIADGTYGYSDESGDPIPKARLEVTPEAIYTVAEQEKRDAAS
jgi:DnaK suppressor protein